MEAIISYDVLVSVCRQLRLSKNNFVRFENITGTIEGLSCESKI